MTRKKREPPKRWQTPKSNEHFTPLYDSLIESEQWKKLSHAARELYILIYHEYRGTYTGNSVKCPYTDIMKYGFSRATISKCIKELEKEGFITCESGGLTRAPNVYHFSDKWVDSENAGSGITKL